MSKHLVFLKLGGSLITVKDRPHTPRPDILEQVAGEIVEARAKDPDLQILLGHGSGSYGHVAASRFNTYNGVKTPEEWLGFVEVWRQAMKLDYLVMATLQNAGLPAVAFPPSAAVTTRSREIITWNLGPLTAALEHGLIPVVYGDVAFDEVLGGTILSTEDLFGHLAHALRPGRLLFAGLELGVWEQYPARSRLVPVITPESFAHVEAGLQGSASTDVTGGMLDKVRKILSLVQDIPRLQGIIFSGETAGNLTKALGGETLGTLIKA